MPLARKSVQVMGIVNATPDSFSDGGLYLDRQAALDHARGMVREGAAMIDVGGESTRPGSAAVDADEELARVLPNDVTGLRGDPDLACICADRAAMVVLVHMLETPRTMQDRPVYADVVHEVRAFLERRIEFAVAAGIPEEQILVDPGIGLGKTLRHNLELLRRLGELAGLGGGEGSWSACRARASSASSGAVPRRNDSAVPRRRPAGRPATEPPSSESTTSPRRSRPFESMPPLPN